MRLTTDQQNRFAQDGYLVIEDVLRAPLLNAIRAEYTDLIDQLYATWQDQGRVPPCDGDFFDKLRVSYQHGCDWFQPMDISLPGDEITAETPFHFGQAVFDMITDPGLLDLVQDLIGPEITSNPIQHVRLKPPAHTLGADEIRAHIAATDWHQDRAVALAEGDATQMVTVWLAITDATVENGCLQVIPGRPQMYPHCPKRQTCIADGYLDPTQARPLPVKAGGAVIFHPLTPHASLINTTDRFRWSFDIRYNVTGQPTGRRHFPNFVARSAVAPEATLTDRAAWQRMWEDTRSTLASTPHIPIHRWSGDAPACA